MSKKPSDGKQDTSAHKPRLRVVDKANGQAVPAVDAKPHGEVIFGESRSGRDRRADAAKAAAAARAATTEQPPVEVADATPRKQSDRRGTTKVKTSAWWLERDYVESHHFVQKSSSSRKRKPELPES